MVLCPPQAPNPAQNKTGLKTELAWLGIPGSLGKVAVFCGRLPVIIRWCWQQIYEKLSKENSKLNLKLHIACCYFMLGQYEQAFHTAGEGTVTVH